MSDYLHFDYTINNVSSVCDDDGFTIYTRLYSFGYPKSLRVKGGVRAHNGKLDIILIPVSDALPFKKPLVLKWKLLTLIRGQMEVLEEKELNLSEGGQCKKDWENGIELSYRELKEKQIVNDDDSLVLIWSGQITVPSHDDSRSFASLAALQKTPENPYEERAEHEMGTGQQKDPYVSVQSDQVTIPSPDGSRNLASLKDSKLTPGARAMDFGQQKSLDEVKRYETYQDVSGFDTVACFENKNDTSSKLRETNTKFGVEGADRTVNDMSSSIADAGLLPAVLTSESISGAASLEHRQEGTGDIMQMLTSFVGSEGNQEQFNHADFAKCASKFIGMLFEGQQGGNTTKGDEELSPDTISANRQQPLIDNNLLSPTTSYRQQPLIDKAGQRSRLGDDLVDVALNIVSQLLQQKQHQHGATAILKTEQTFSTTQIAEKWKSESIQREMNERGEQFRQDDTHQSTLSDEERAMRSQKNNQTRNQVAELEENVGAALITAAENKNVEHTTPLLRDETSKINSREENGTKHLASGVVDQETLSMLEITEASKACSVETGANLIEAIFAGHVEVVRDLLEKGADVNAQIGLGFSALQAATLLGHSDIVKLLLEKEADTDVGGLPGVSALMIATFIGNPEIVEMLLDKNADTESAFNFNAAFQSIPAFINVMNMGNFWPEFVPLLRKMIPQTTLNALQFMSTEKGFESTIASLSEDMLKSSEMTPLLMAVLLGHTDVVKLLAKYGANVNIRIWYGSTTLMLACLSGHFETAEVLLDCGADVNACPDNKITALMTTSYAGHVEIVKLLLRHDADPDMRSNDGLTALMIACAKGHYDIVKLLLKSEVDANQSGETGVTLLMLACLGGHTEIVKFLLEQKADIEQQADSGINALMLACLNNHSETVRCLLGENADVDKQTDAGETALMIACDRGHNSMVKLLIESNADINKVNNKGYSALMLACNKGHCDVVRLLLQNNADINAHESEIGYSPLLMAHTCGHGDVVSILLDFMAQQCRSAGNSPDGQPTPNVAAETEVDGKLSSIPLEYTVLRDQLENLGAHQEGDLSVWSDLVTFGKQISMIFQPGPLIKQMFNTMKFGLDLPQTLDFDFSLPLD